LMSMFILACGFFTLPVFATYFALRVKNLIAAAVLTWVALFLPLMMAPWAAIVSTESEMADVIWTLPAIFLSYLVFALLAVSLLRHSLSRRIYSF